MSRYTLNPIVQALTYEERISIVKQAVLMFTEEYIIVSMSQEDWLFDLKDILDKHSLPYFTDNTIDFCWRVVRGDYNCDYWGEMRCMYSNTSLTDNMSKL
jgi:hypothetical protein